MFYKEADQLASLAECTWRRMERWDARDEINEATITGASENPSCRSRQICTLLGCTHIYNLLDGIFDRALLAAVSLPEDEKVQRTLPALAVAAMLS